MPYREFFARTIGLFKRGRQEADLSDEIQSHLDELTEAHLRNGASLEAARAAAQHAFGGVEQIKERYPDQRGFAVWEAFSRVVRIALPTSLTHRTFAAVVIVTPGLGIGAAAAAFTLLNQVVLRRLPLSRCRSLHSPEIGGSRNQSRRDLEPIDC